MRILAIDPGSDRSAFVLIGDKSRLIHACGIFDNPRLLKKLEHRAYDENRVVIECTKAYTIQFKKKSNSFFPQQVLDTNKWVGRFEQASQADYTEIDRREVKKALGVPVTGGDPHVKAALIERWGGQNKAIGGKKCEKCKGKGWVGRDHSCCPVCEASKWLYPPGPLYELSKTGKDVWAALAVAVTFMITGPEELPVSS